MDSKRLAAILAMAGASLCAGQSAPAQKATVTVCMDGDPHVPMGVRPAASAMFASIGVRIDWRDLDSCPAGIGAIQVRLSYDSHSIRNSEALAFAHPYAGTVVVLVDRVKELSRHWGIAVMAHVLVHEITHVVEGIDRHSAIGIMKARWSDRDYFEMQYKPLAFAKEDIDLIYAGLKAPSVAPAAVAASAAVAGR